MCGYARRIDLVEPEQEASEHVPQYRTREHKGFGVYFKFKDGPGQMGGLQKELIDEDIQKFRRRLEAPIVDASRSWLTRWNDLSKTIEVIFGSPVPII